MSYDARDVANYILDRSDEKGLKISNLALQKLIYFVHGWFYAFYDQPLIRNKFEAWKLGPVQRVLYDQFKAFGARPIVDMRAKFIEPSTGQKVFRVPIIEEDHAAIIDSILQKYEKFSAGELVELTHVEDGPWEFVWKQAEESVYPGMHIPEELIAAHFKSLKPILTLH